eukprot:gnl/MRDRNA2_/MRDRNA2_52455_c0_seq1.p2 gnl/MRDRNA2_/MRDRNA2_52455_c0~~gnl/MRDRNA2_/MRDRNA2_52455_c0_seq1.p2  ORF type:complete len:198 (+),score=72.43 gnl/MRDRNA2_/MRDRNA2_52455_c0_seq1:101-694(+)
MDPEAPEGEEVEALSEEKRLADPLWQVRIKNTIAGKTFAGRVVGIDEGTQTKERLYLVQYEDGDLEHMTADSVKSCVDKPVSASPRRGASSPAASPSPAKPGARGRPKKSVVQEDAAAEIGEEEEPPDAVEEPKAMKGMKAPKAKAKAKAMKAVAKAKAMKVVKPPAMKAAPKAKAKAKAKPKAKPKAVMKKTKAKK